MTTDYDVLSDGPDPPYLVDGLQDFKPPKGDVVGPITKLIHWFSNNFMNKTLCAIMGYKNRTATFEANYWRYMRETSRLDKYLDRALGTLDEKLSNFRDDLHLLLDKEELPKGFDSKARGLADALCRDYEILHKGRTKGALDVLKRKVNSYSQLFWLTLIAKTFPEVSPESKRVKLCMKLAPLFGMIVSGVDDLMDTREDLETPHLNSYLTWRGGP